MQTSRQGPMRLYIWRDIFCDYTCGIAFCMAHSLEEAFSVMKAKLAPHDFSQLTGDPEVHDEPFGSHVWGGG